MISIFKKEVVLFFSSLIGYIVIGVFLLVLGLMLWVFPDWSIIDSNFAALDSLFTLAPLIFVFLIPALTMRSFAEENQTGTIEMLITRPVKDYEIVLGKYLACLFLVFAALLPTVIYYYSVYQLGSPKGNLDSGGIMGSYIGLFLLAASFVAIGIFSSALTSNQIVSFLIAFFLCFFVHYAFSFISKMPVFVGKLDDVIQRFGIDAHYTNISRGIVDTRDIVYFISLISIFLLLTLWVLAKRKW